MLSCHETKFTASEINIGFNHPSPEWPEVKSGTMILKTPFFPALLYSLVDILRVFEEEFSYLWVGV